MAERQYDLNKAAELKHGKLPQLQKQLEAEQHEVAEGGASLRYKFMVLKTTSQGLRHGEDLDPNLQPIPESLTSRHCLMPDNGRLKVECLWNSLEIAL